MASDKTVTDQLLAQFMSRELSTTRVFEETTLIDPDLKGDDSLVTERKETPYFVRFWTVPQYTEVRADIARLGGIAQAASVIFPKVIKYSLCTEDGTRLLDDNATFTNTRVDDLMLSVYQQGMEKNGIQMPIIRRTGKPASLPENAIAGNSEATP